MQRLTALTALADHQKFFLGIIQLCQLLTPFTLVMYAVQSDDATMADVMRYWYFLARQMDAMKANLTDPAFTAHCIAAFNWQDMHKRIAHLGGSYRSIRRTCTAASQWQNNRRSETLKLLSELDLYKQGPKLFLITMSDGGLDSLQSFWGAIQHTAVTSGAPLQLPALAVIFQDIKPHAADSEKPCNLMVCFHTSRRNQLRSDTTTAVTTMKMHFIQKSDAR